MAGGDFPSALEIDFCICKATEGINFVDQYCNGFIEDCKSSKKLWGFYHFNGQNNPEDEAQFFYDNCKNYFGYGIPVLDYEVETWNDREWAERFMQKVHELSGIWPMLYTSASWLQKFYGSWLPEKCGLWLAGYPYTMTTWTDDDIPYDISPWSVVAIWQFTSNLILPGYWNRLDGDIAYMDEKAWMKYAQSTDNPQNVDNDDNVKPIEPDKSIDEYVRETLNGIYGNGEERRKALGNKYDEVQNRINELYNIADSVIAGNWGNGWNRQNALEGAGYPYDIVQQIVNEKLL